LEEDLSEEARSDEKDLRIWDVEILCAEDPDQTHSYRSSSYKRGTTLEASYGHLARFQLIHKKKYLTGSTCSCDD